MEKTNRANGAVLKEPKSGTVDYYAFHIVRDHLAHAVEYKDKLDRESLVAYVARYITWLEKTHYYDASEFAENGVTHRGVVAKARELLADDEKIDSFLREEARAVSAIIIDGAVGEFDDRQERMLKERIKFLQTFGEKDALIGLRKKIAALGRELQEQEANVQLAEAALAASLRNAQRDRRWPW
ncbi:MAG: hypothetical protein KGI04_02020 [Candidatus Micrarchaeota archaeon]|nr:hypothetical protein [Candidatus Micrarchaeota archaeon]